MICMEINVSRFLAFLIAENQKQNLVSRKAGKEELSSHVEDSLRVLEFRSLSGKQIIDIGSGAGFPALILAIYCPDAAFVLVESDLKKSEFLRAACSELGLKNVQVIRERAEVIGRDPAYRARFDYCTSRAVAAMNIMLEYGVPLLKRGGSMLLWKSRNYKQEMEEAQTAMDILQARTGDIFAYSLLEEKDRVIIEVIKEADTPEQYPRRTGIPSKRPL